MNLNLHIEAETPTELQQAITGLAQGWPAPVKQEAPSVDEPKKNRKAKAKDTAPAEKQEVAPEEQPSLNFKEESVAPEPPTIDPEVPLDEPIPDVVELRALASEKGQADAANKPKIKALLDSYECKSISTVPEDKRLAFKKDLEEL